MKKLAFAASMLLASVLACTAPTSGSTPAPTGSVPLPDTSQPTTAAPAARQALIQSADLTLALYDASGQSTPFGKADFVLSGIGQPAVFGNSLYALSGFSQAHTGPTRAYQIDPSGTHLIEVVPEGVPGFAAWPGDGARPARVAWGEYPNGDTLGQIMVADVGAATGTQVYQMDGGQSMLYPSPYRWTGDGSHLYFSIEPSGLGGYILFSGISSLYSLDLASGDSTAIIPPDPEHNIICLGELSPDETLIGSHCDNQISLIDLQSTAKTLISFPPEVPIEEIGQLGDVRFSPDGKRIAFALAHGDPENEQGWIAVTDDLSGASRLLAASPAGSFYSVIGWLDANHLLISTYNAETNLNNLFILPLDGSAPREIVHGGTFLTFVP